MNYAQNIGNNVNGAYERSSTLQKVLSGVVVILLIYFVYIMFIKKTTDKNVLKEHPAVKAHQIKADEIPPASGSDYSISVWIYVDQWNYNYGKEKHVLGRYIKNGDEYLGAPSITMDAYTNDVKVRVAYLGDGTNAGKKQHTCVVKGIPLQKWVCIIMAVNNRTLDVYLDGKLTRTCVLPGVPQTAQDGTLYVGSCPTIGMDGGFAGHITDLRMFSKAINPTQAYNLYKQGNSMSGLGSMVNRYKFKFSLMDNNTETSKFIFPK